MITDLLTDAPLPECPVSSPAGTSDARRRKRKEKDMAQRTRSQSTTLYAAVTPKTSEHEEQSALFAWAALYTTRTPELALLYAIPNGGARHPAVAAKMKREGVKRGAPDTCLPIARNGQHGCYIELKTARGRPTTEQLWWGERLVEQGYTWSVCYGWQSAARLIVAYLGGTPEEYGL